MIDLSIECVLTARPGTDGVLSASGRANIISVIKTGTGSYSIISNADADKADILCSLHGEILEVFRLLQQVIQQLLQLRTLQVLIQAIFDKDLSYLRIAPPIGAKQLLVI